MASLCRFIPLLSEEGWLRDQEMSRSHLDSRRRGGEPITKTILLNHHSVRSASEWELLIDVAATPPRRGGERTIASALACFITRRPS